MEIRFEKTLRELMRDKGINHNELADFLGVKRSTITMYVNGKSYPEFRTLIKIAEFFNVSLDYLVTGERIENQTVRQELGLSETAVENLKEIADGKKLRGLPAYLDDLLSDKKFFEIFSSTADYFMTLATYYPLVREFAEKEYGLTFSPDGVMDFIETQTARKMTDYFVGFFKEQNIIRTIKNRNEYEEIVRKQSKSE